MSPYPMDPADARGPMRIVATTFPTAAGADRAMERIVAARLASCAHAIPIRSRYWWHGRRAGGAETLVTFHTVPKLVGALMDRLRQAHPYEVPWIAELDTHRVVGKYLEYLARELDPSSPPPPLGGGPTRRAAPRGRGARAPARTRAPPRPRSTRSRRRR
ncbi:MAG: divalent-cation tolerance protein CutA [Thermoplasmata archaeon]